jgi:hypothetical protein
VKEEKESFMRGGGSREYKILDISQGFSSFTPLS